MGQLCGKWHLLLLLITWISLSTQRALSQPDDGGAVAMLMAGYEDPSPPAASGAQLAEGGNALGARHAWLRGRARDRQARPHGKRGFSMLARWKPFNSLAKQRTSIRNINRAPFMPAANDFEMVSAETRAFSRPSGQPLRWG